MIRQSKPPLIDMANPVGTVVYRWHGLLGWLFFGAALRLHLVGGRHRVGVIASNG